MSQSSLREIRHIQRELKVIDLERKFKWKTPKYQKEHTFLLDQREENLRKKLEAIL